MTPATTGIPITVAILVVLGLLAPTNAATQGLRADGGFTSTPIRECHSDLRFFNQVSGWQTAWPAQWETLVAGAPTEIAQAIENWTAVPDALQETQIALQAGIENERTAPRAVVLRIHQQVRDLARLLTERDASYYFSDETHANAARWNRQMETIIAPAVSDFASFLEDSYLDAANPIPGLAGVVGGAECFANAAAWWTTLTMTPEEIETAGRRLLTETRAALLTTGANGDTVGALMSRLREAQTRDETTAEQLREVSIAAIGRAAGAVTDMFSVAPDGDVTVVEMPAHMQASFPAGFYRASQNDRPAAYVLNPSRPGERRLMAEVIAFHETVPGHHLFFAYPREVSTGSFNAGIAEGWAIYAEYVADEMGLYSSNFDRQGMITKHLWAASRLVVEPGLHIHGWSRADAIAFMLDNTVLSRAEVEIEVDRYLALPGQSLSYMLGADLIMRERQRAKKSLGASFGIKEFHDVILSGGVRPLPKLQSELRTWVASKKVGSE